MKQQISEYTLNKSVGFFGIGKSNLALINEISKTNSNITLRSDGKIDKSLPHERIFEGRCSCDEITEDVIFFSPSVRRDRQEFLCALGRGVEFTSDLELFLKYNNQPLFTVTGTDGKTTTAFLGARILNQPNRTVTAIGNIGEPASLHIGENFGSFVLEASSFMLEYASPASERAVITSLSPEHLSWHYGYEEYKRVKMKALDNAKEAVVSSDSWDLVDLVRGKKLFAVTGMNTSVYHMKNQISAEYYFGVENGYITENGRRLIAIKELKKAENYNVKSYLSTLALTRGYTDEDHALEIIADFGGIEHRGELFLLKNGVKFINSSIDTSPTRTAETLRATPGNIILLLGGRSKGLDYTPLKSAIKKSKIKAIICFGEAGGEIFSSLEEREATIKKSLGEAVDATMEIAIENDTVLLSPACTSFDEFSSFEERGLFFKNRVFSSF